MNQQYIWILFLLGLIVFTIINGIYNLASQDTAENFRGYFDPYDQFAIPYEYPRLLRFFNLPGLTPAYFRNYGEMLDPYYPQYYQTYYTDLPYYYYNRNNFDRYRKLWGSSSSKRHKRHLRTVPSKTKCTYC